jgi:hypothetical protein
LTIAIQPWRSPTKIDDEFWASAELPVSTEPFGGSNWWKFRGRISAIDFSFELRQQTWSNLMVPSRCNRRVD